MPLPKASLAKVRAAIDRLFNKARQMVLGREIGDKSIVISSTANLGDLYELAVESEGGVPSSTSIATAKEIAKAYLDAAQAKAQAQILKDIDSTIREVEAAGGNPDAAGIVGAKLAETLQSVTSTVKTIIETETNTVKNVGAAEGIMRNAAIAGDDDPVVFFRVLRSPPWPCDECVGVHLLPDGITPRVFKLSEMSHGYHKKGDDTPCVGGLHPNCHCHPCACPPGYGFSGGALVFIGLDHDEWEKQRER